MQIIALRDFFNILYLSPIWIFRSLGYHARELTQPITIPHYILTVVRRSDKNTKLSILLDPVIGASYLSYV